MNQHRKMFALRLPPDLIERLDAWCSTQKPRVTKTAVIEMLIADFLDAKGAAGTKPPARGGKRGG